MSIIVTGGAGMIGSNIIEGLNKSGHNDIIVVDHLKNGGKFRNISNLDISDYYDKKYFMKQCCLKIFFSTVRKSGHGPKP